MMTKTDATIKGVKEMQHELSAQEGRLSYIRSEIESLKRAKEALEKEITEKKEAFQYDVETRLTDARKRSEAAFEEQKKLELQKAEFQKILTEFQREKNAFERIKSDTINAKENYDKMYEKIGVFVTLVKRHAESL